MARALVKNIAESKNYLMNAGFDIWQRNNTTTPQNEDTTLGYKGPDRWRHRYDDLVASSTVHTWARVADAPVTISTDGYPSAFRGTYRRGNLGIYNAILQQRIESRFARELYNDNPSQLMSIAAWVKSDTSNSVRITVFTPTAQDNHASQSQIYQTTVSFTANSTWQQVKFENLAVTSSMVNGLAIQFEILSPAAAGADGSDRDFRFTMPQLNKGGVITPFRLFAENPPAELLTVKRYYNGSGVISSEASLASGVRGGLDAYIFPVEMRVAPTVVSFGNGVANSVRNNNTGATEATGNILYGASTIAVGIRATVTLSDDVQYGATLTIDAEL